MKICYFDAFSGISGDMTVGALVDAGANWETLQGALCSLDLGASFSLKRTKRKGIAAAKFTVESQPEQKHRHLPQIEQIISRGELPARSRENSLAVFRKLAEAEATSHGVSIEAVHFHEVGAIDSICDVVGACVALDLLEVEEVRCSRINVGSGTIKTEHGVLPVPAPATAHLLKNYSVYSSGPETELTTPTGAALISTLCTGFGGLPAVRVVSQGFGAGDQDFPAQANVLRVLIGEQADSSEATAVTVLETNLDDSTPQVLGYAMERLLAAGALDVTLTPIFMKKNRPGTMLSVISTPEQAAGLAAILFAETTTLGVRILQAERRVLQRRTTEIETLYGRIRVKHTENGAFAPEYEDCRRAAAEKGVPLRTVIAEANDAFRRRVNP